MNYKKTVVAVALIGGIGLGTVSTLDTNNVKADSHATVSKQVLTNQVNQVKNGQSTQQAQSAVTVSSWSEFEAALKDKNVTDVSLNNNIQVEAAFLAKGLTKNIHGNGHTIDADNHDVKLDTINAVGEIDNAKIVNTNSLGILWSDLSNVKVTYRNVEHSGKEMLQLYHGELILDGTVSSTSGSEEVFEGQHLTINPNAVVDFSNSSSSHSPIQIITSHGKMSVGSGAVLTVNSVAKCIDGVAYTQLENNGTMRLKSTAHQAIYLADHGEMNFNKGSRLTAIAHDEVNEGIKAYLGNIYVHSGATFGVTSSGHQATILAGGKLIFEKGANYAVVNTNPRGAIFGSDVHTQVTLQSDNGIRTWNRENVTNENPDHEYKGEIESSFDIIGIENTVTQTDMQSNNTDFASTFKTKEVGKITGGNFNV